MKLVTLLSAAAAICLSAFASQAEGQLRVCTDAERASYAAAYSNAFSQYPQVRADANAIMDLITSQCLLIDLPKN